MSARTLHRALPANLPPLSRLLVTLALTFAAWETRARGRRALARLDDHLLRDIGLNDGRATREASKSFWQD
jgi:uncharacterized protein YjiS (DUF1127 family)